jgi:F-type H+-transporting ATPase subunit d
MAARRVAKSAVDWAALAERVPPNQKDAFRAFKTKSDLFVSKVHRFPENLPQIDFASYTARLGNAPFIGEFEKAYKALTIAYPKDKNNVKAQVEAQEKEAQVETKQRILEARKVIEDSKAMLAKIDSVPGPDVMTHEMYSDYFPDLARNPWDKPTFWPHTKAYQPENDPHTCK